MQPNQETALADYQSPENNPTEAAISKRLWDWRFASPPERERVVADSQLAILLEFWMPFGEIEYTRGLGTWCDGVPLLVIEDIHRTAFRVSGVGYFPYEILPFEIDFYYHNRRDLRTAKIIFRFGTVAVRNSKQGYNRNRNPQAIYDRRPCRIQDWAVVVELTPSE